MLPWAERSISAVLVVALTMGCGSSLEERRPDEPIARAPGARESRVLFAPATPRAMPGPGVSPAELVAFLEKVLRDVPVEALDGQWRQIVSDPRFRSLRAEAPRPPYRLVLASWDSGSLRLEEITLAYQQWCSVEGRRARCMPIPRGQQALGDAEVYKVAFDFAMGAQWDGFTHEVRGMLQPSTLRMVILTGMVIFMACLAIPELTSKIPVAIATAVLTAYLGAQAVCDLVFGWIRMVREVDAATTFEQVREAGERYGRLIGAETARVLIMLAMAALSEGGVIARLMKLPQIGAASAALAADTGGVGLEAITQVSGATVLQGGVSIIVAGAAQGAVGVAMAGRGGAPNIRTALPIKPPQKPVDIKLRYKEEWTAEQRADARAKVKMLNEAEDKAVIRNTKARRVAGGGAKYRKQGNEVPEGCDVDHCVDLQLGGSDTLDNMWPLDSSVNRSLGVQIRHAIKDLPEGTRIGRITIE